jgi:uncharacterized protein (TIGR03067 family)
MTRSLVVVAFVAGWLYPPLWSPTLRIAAAQEKKDQELIQGSWKVAKMEHEGRVIPGPFREDTWIFKDDELRMVGTAGEGHTYFKATFKLDPSKQPKSIEMSITGGVANVGKTHSGIYRIDGDKLVICQGADLPKEFSGKGNAVLLEFERVKDK